MKRRRFISALTLATGAAALRPTARAIGAAGGAARIKKQSDGGQLTSAERRVGDVSILDLRGQITGSRGSVALSRAIARLRRDGRRKVLINLADVSNIDDRGIGSLVSAYTTINRDSGQLKLLNLTAKVKDLLAITKLLTVFDVYDNEAEALNSFKDAPAPRGQDSGKQHARAAGAATSDTEIENKVKQIIVDELGVKEARVKPAARFIEDLGADSLDIVELVMRFEEEFGIEIPDEDAEKLERVRDVYSYIKRKLAGRPKK
ncbi:MAG: anti-sigma factor antagonist [Acidobacteriota bacterium]|jgi:acyl carrier protein|nr:anti-sigma factor antagonist [Acidobacteriota bacterium]